VFLAKSHTAFAKWTFINVQNQKAGEKLGKKKTPILDFKMAA